MEKKKKIAIAALVLAFAAAAVIWAAVRPKEVTNYDAVRPKEVTNYDAVFEEDQERPENEGEEASVGRGIQIPGYKSIEIPAGTKDVSVELTNPEENQVYFQISFYLPETDETIYSSDLIKPGQSLYEITLEKEMEAGEYPLTVQYATFTADEEMAPQNGAEVNCTLVVR